MEHPSQGERLELIPGQAERIGKFRSAAERQPGSESVAMGTWLGDDAPEASTTDRDSDGGTSLSTKSPWTCASSSWERMPRTTDHRATPPSSGNDDIARIHVGGGNLSSSADSHGRKGRTGPS